MATLLYPGQRVAERYDVRAAVEELPGCTTYAVFDREAEVEVALWLVRDELFSSPVARDQLLGAASIARAIGHPNVRRVFDAGPLGATAYVTVQPAAAGGLRSRLDARAPALEPELLAYAQALCDGVTAGHQAGLLHGRLTPDCVVAVGGLLKVGGIGLWGQVEPHAARFAWRGQERYLAPEVLAGGGPSVAADVYAIAVMLGELVTGAAAPDGAALAASLAEWHHHLAPLLVAALSQAPARRPPSVADFLTQLRRISSGEEPTTGERPAVAVPGLAPMPAPPPAAATPQPTAPAQAPQPQPLPPAPIVDDGATVVDSGPPVHAPRPKRATAPWSGIARGKARGHEPVGWTEVRLRASRETQREPEDKTTSERPAVAPAQPAPLVIRAISMKPKSHPGTKPPPPIAAIDRPEMQPVLRSIASTMTPSTLPPVQLGYYAPPKATPLARPARAHTSWGKIAAIGLVAAVAMALAVWFVLSRTMKRDTRPAPRTGPAPSAPAPQPRPSPVVIEPGAAPAAGPCADDMTPIPGEPLACIDIYESPGRGRLPQTGMSQTEAADACRARGARLCGDVEWERACRGPGGASYPYGESYRVGPCNTDTAKSGVVAVGGGFPDCRSAAGAMDMSGNVAEWVAEGWSKGGSALDHSDGRCSAKEPRADGRRYSEVGFRCCADPHAH